MNWEIVAAIGLWIFASGAMGWNRMFRGYCLQSLAYFKHEVLPQLQNDSAWNDEAADLDDLAIPETHNYVTDSAIMIILLMCTVAVNSALLIFTIFDIAYSPLLAGLVASSNATIAVWISVSRKRYFKVQAHVYACYTLLQAKEFHTKSLDEIEKIEEEEDGEQK